MPSLDDCLQVFHFVYRQLTPLAKCARRRFCPRPSRRGLALLEERHAERVQTIRRRWAAAGSPSATTIGVTTLSGETRRVHVGPGATGAELRAHIAEIVGIPEAEVVLVPPGRTVPVEDSEVAVPVDTDGNTELVPLMSGAFADEEDGLPASVSSAPWNMVRVHRRQALSGSVDGTLKLWDLDSGSCIQTLFGHTDVVFCLMVDWNRRRALSGSGDGTPRLWGLDDKQSREALGGGQEGTVFCVSVDWRGRRAVTGSGVGTLRIWDLDCATCVRTLTGHRAYVCCIAADWLCEAGGGALLAVSGSEDRTVRLWDLDKGTCMETWQQHEGTVFCISVDWQRRIALTGSADGTLRLWDIGPPSTCRRTFRDHAGGVCSLAVDWARRRVVSGSFDRTLRVWDLDSEGGCLETLRGHTGAVWCVDVQWNQRRVMSGSFDRTIRIWDLDTQDCVHTLRGHNGGVLCLSANWNATNV